MRIIPHLKYNVVICRHCSKAPNATLMSHIGIHNFCSVGSLNCPVCTFKFLAETEVGSAMFVYRSCQIINFLLLFLTTIVRFKRKCLYVGKRSNDLLMKNRVHKADHPLFYAFSLFKQLPAKKRFSLMVVDFN